MKYNKKNEIKQIITRTILLIVFDRFKYILVILYKPYVKVRIK